MYLAFEPGMKTVKTAKLLYSLNLPVIIGFTLIIIMLVAKQTVNINFNVRGMFVFFVTAAGIAAQYGYGKLKDVNLSLPVRINWWWACLIIVAGILVYMGYLVLTENDKTTGLALLVYPLIHILFCIRGLRAESSTA